MLLPCAWFATYFVIAHHQSGRATSVASSSVTVDASNTYTTTAFTIGAENSGTATANSVTATATSGTATANPWNSPSSATVSSTTAPNVNMTANSTIIVKPGVIFAASQSYLTRYGDSECFCNTLCQTDPRCTESCWITYPEIGYCRLTDLDYTKIVQLKRSSGHTAFNMPSNVFLGSDNKFYFMVNQKMKYQDADKVCASQDNFQVGIYKTKVQLDLLKTIVSQYNSAIWVDMNSITNGVSDAYAVWADGTPFNDTEISQNGLSELYSNEASTTSIVKFRFDGTTFFDRALSDNDNYAVLCQERIIPN